LAVEVALLGGWVRFWFEGELLPAHAAAPARGARLLAQPFSLPARPPCQPGRRWQTGNLA
jgi:hypothetical protein